MAAPIFSKRVPRYFGALFLAWFCVFAVGCEERRTPDWKQPSAPAVAVTPVSTSRPPRAPDAEGAPLRFLAYNVENYLRMERSSGGRSLENAPKPEDSVAALVEIIAEARPDVLGVCEIGTLDDAEDLQSRLAKAGVDLPHFEYTHGADPVRRLVLFSRHPIVARNSVTRGSFQVQGRRAALLRGILDATVEHGGQRTRFLGVHLKSKRDSEIYDQELVRRAEARLLRRHIDEIFTEEPSAALVVYGDFNDTRRTPTVRTIQGNYRSADFLDAVPLADEHGQRWTYHWGAEDIYSRIDFILVSRNLADAVDQERSNILNPENWREASDHRPLLLQLR